MKTACSFLLVWATLGLFTSATAQTTPAQSKPTSEAKAPREANRKAQKYKSPMVVENTEELGRKIHRVSRQTDGPVRLRDIKK